MPDHRSRDLGAADDDLERSVLALLLESKHPGPWSVHELARELGGELHTADAVARLHCVGLLHRCDDYAWPTRAAARFHQLADAA
jgi:hypothetical protein